MTGVTPRALAVAVDFLVSICHAYSDRFFFPDLWAGANAQSFGIQGVVGVGVGMGWERGAVSRCRGGMEWEGMSACFVGLFAFFCFIFSARAPRKLLQRKMRCMASLTAQLFRATGEEPPSEWTTAPAFATVQYRDRVSIEEALILLMR